MAAYLFARVEAEGRSVFLGPITTRENDCCSDDVGHTKRCRIGLGSQLLCDLGSCAHTPSLSARRCKTTMQLPKGHGPAACSLL
jgi:hypothetical protein